MFCYHNNLSQTQFFPFCISKELSQKVNNESPCRPFSGTIGHYKKKKTFTFIANSNLISENPPSIIKTWKGFSVSICQLLNQVHIVWCVLRTAPGTTSLKKGGGGRGGIFTDCSSMMILPNLVSRPIAQIPLVGNWLMVVVMMPMMIKWAGRTQF